MTFSSLLTAATKAGLGEVSMGGSLIIARLLATYPAGYVCWLLLRMRAAASPPFIRLPPQLPLDLRLQEWSHVVSMYQTVVMFLCVKRRVSEPHGLCDAAAPAPGGGARACCASCGHVAFEIKDNFLASIALARQCSVSVESPQLPMPFSSSIMQRSDCCTQRVPCLVSVIIPTHNRWSLLQVYLFALCLACSLFSLPCRLQLLQRGADVARRRNYRGG
jgi:hypothetical protein